MQSHRSASFNSTLPAQEDLFHPSFRLTTSPQNTHTARVPILFTVSLFFDNLHPFSRCSLRMSLCREYDIEVTMTDDISDFSHALTGFSKTYCVAPRALISLTCFVPQPFYIIQTIQHDPIPLNEPYQFYDEYHEYDIPFGHGICTSTSSGSPSSSHIYRHHVSKPTTFYTTSTTTCPPTNFHSNLY